MSKTGTSVIIDGWLHLLNQLNTQTGVLGRRLYNIRGKNYQPTTFMLLKEAGLITSSHGGYRLRYPLSDIPFSVIVNLWSLSSSSYTRRLFLHYSHLSVATICSLPELKQQYVPTSLDSVCHVIRALRYNEFICARYFYPTSYSPAYGTIIAKGLAQQNLVMHSPRKGYVLLKRQEDIRIGDFMRAVSTKSTTLSKILLLAKDVSVAKLFKNRG